MATILASDLVERANNTLNDTLSMRWPDPLLLDLLNDAQLAVVAKRPDACVKNTQLACAAQVTQELPPDGLRLINVMANTLDQDPITLIDVRVLNEQVPDWRKTDLLASRVEHFAYDDRDPKHFYVYPAPRENLQIDLVYSVAPGPIPSLGATISLDDIYSVALVEYMLYRCYQRDTENQANAARAAAHYNAFEVALGGKIKADAAASPNND